MAFFAKVFTVLLMGASVLKAEEITLLKHAPENKKLALVSALNAEMGSARVVLPRSKKPLPMDPYGEYDEDAWNKVLEKSGISARPGDRLQITKIEFLEKKVIFQFNHGAKGGRKWWHRIQVSGGASSNNPGTTLGQGQQVFAPFGTSVAIEFKEGVPLLEAEDFKAMLDPFVDWELRSASEQFLDSIDPVFKEAIEQGEPLVGMTREMLVLAMKNKFPDNKEKQVSPTTGDVLSETWVYGGPHAREKLFIKMVKGVVVDVKKYHLGS